MSRTCLILAAMLCARSLVAQTVVRPEPPLDSARVTLRDALISLRDSLSSIHAAAGRLQRDYRESSAASLLSRAMVMREACARSSRTVPPTKEVVAASKASTDLRRKRQRELVEALDQLRVALTRCEADFGAMGKSGQGEQVRGYGNDRAGRTQAAIRKYSWVAESFLAAMGIKVAPLGTENRALAS
jgi:hypothetical protein